MDIIQNKISILLELLEYTKSIRDKEQTSYTRCVAKRQNYIEDLETLKNMNLPSTKEKLQESVNRCDLRIEVHLEKLENLNQSIQEILTELSNYQATQSPRLNILPPN